MTGAFVNTIIVEGFKCFDALKLELGRLTLVTGLNGGGKSTALQSLLLIAQALRMGEKNKLPLNGPLVRLGTAGDISPRWSEKDTLLRAEGEEVIVEFRPKRRPGYRSLPLLNRVDGGAYTSLSTLSFLSAYRIGGQDAFPIPEKNSVHDVGSDGRYAAYWYDHLVDEEVDDLRCVPGAEAKSFRKQIDAWLSTLFPGAEAHVQHIADVSQMSLRFKLSETDNWQRPANMGYGLTYAFPILVSLLSAQNGQIIVIDSPEAHLHPSAQSRMGQVLAHFANAGVQIIVETHSDHLLNGVRLAVRRGELLPEDLRIHFFSGVKGQNHGVVSPQIGEGGEIYEWPNDFFDQGEKDLSQLAGWS